MEKTKRSRQYNLRKGALSTMAKMSLSSTSRINGGFLPRASRSFGSSVSRAACENCKNCVCKQWLPYLTDEVLHFLQAFTESLERDDPIPDNSANDYVRLHPCAHYAIPRADLDVIEFKSGQNANHYIRNILEYFLTEDELLEIGSADKVSKKYENFKVATIGYINSKVDHGISPKTWTKVVNRKIQSIRTAKLLTEEEKLQIKVKKRKSIQESRERKKMQLENSGSNKDSSARNVSPDWVAPDPLSKFQQIWS